MYFLDAVRAFRRRWKAAVAGLLVILALAAGTWVVVPTQYEATGQMLLLLKPDATGKATPTNPYLNQPSGLLTTAAFVAGTLSTQDAARSLAKAGFKADYTVVTDPTSGPVLRITTTDSDPKAALATRNELIRRLQATLARVQKEEGVPTAQVIESRTDSVSADTDTLVGNPVKATGAVLLVGLALLVILVVGPSRSRVPAAGRSTPRRRAVVTRTEPVGTAVAEPEPSAGSVADPAPVVTPPAAPEPRRRRAATRGGRRTVRRPAPDATDATGTFDTIDEDDDADHLVPGFDHDHDHDHDHDDDQHEHGDHDATRRTDRLPGLVQAS